MLNKIVKSGYLCLVPDFRRNNVNFSQVSIMLAIVLSYMAFFYVEVFFFIPTLLRVFITNTYWILSKVFFFCIYSDETTNFILHMLIIIITLISLLGFNHPCIPGVNLNWPWCVTLLTYFWIWFVNILLSIFASIFIGGINLSLSLLWYACLVEQWSYNSLWNEWIQYSFKITCKHEFSFRIAKTTYTWVA